MKTQTLSVLAALLLSVPGVAAFQGRTIPGAEAAAGGTIPKEAVPGADAAAGGGQDEMVRCPEVQEADSLIVMFWNVENFFDWTDSGFSSSDEEFSAEGSRRWSRSRFNAKCNAVAKTVFAAADRYGALPDAVCFAELENGLVLRRLLSGTSLSRAGYRVLHYDSPDPRGIDCGMIYRERSLPLRRSSACHIYDTAGAVMPTRDILLAEFDSLCILVNHHPSKLGGKSDRRQRAMLRLDSLRDSLAALGKRVLSLGDFNEDIWTGNMGGPPGAAAAVSASARAGGAGGVASGSFAGGARGTIKYNGAWEKIDGHIADGFRAAREYIFEFAPLLTRDRAYGGMKPLRTYSGPRYLGGVSDHLPIVVVVYF